MLPFLAIVIIQRQITFPDVLTNVPIIIPALAGTISLHLVMMRWFDAGLASYGISLDREWVYGLVAGIVIGFIYQCLITTILMVTGSGEVLSLFAIDLDITLTTWLIAFVSTMIGFFGVALWEELVFRGILITHAAEGFASWIRSDRRAVLAAVSLGPIIFGLPHVLAIADGATPYFAMVQASMAALYFGLAYVVTRSLAVPIGIHFISNLWFTAIFGAPENGFPALVRIDRSMSLGLDSLLEVGLPFIVLVGLIFLYERETGGSIDFRGFLDAS